jgi:tRNA (cmo5U34)-methyltransferase
VSRGDHHDWASEAYVDEWVQRQRSEDAARADRFQLMCDLFPFPTGAIVTILDVGAGYGPLSAFVLDRYPRATCVGQDASEPMLSRARKLMAGYGERFVPHRSDLFEAAWLPERLGPFDAAVSSICLHNLRDFGRIREIYGEIRGHLKPGGVFLNLDLVNAPSGELDRRYVGVGAVRRRRAGASDADVEAMVRRGRPSPFPATLDQQLAALDAAGFRDVDCFWKELRLALLGGFA